MKNNLVNWRRFPLIHLLLAAMLSLASITTLVNTQPVFAAPSLQSESDDATQDPLEDGNDDSDDSEDDEDGEDDDEDGDENEVHGTVDSMPSGSLIGNWTVDGVQYVASEATEFEEEDGAFAVGSAVELEFTVVDGINQLDEIETDSETDSESDMDSTDEDETSASVQTEVNSNAVENNNAVENSNAAENNNEFVTLARAFGIDLQNFLFLPTFLR